jgi:hypothetical protein
VGAVRLNDVMDELALTVGAATGLTAYEWPPATVPGGRPCVIVSYPERINYDQTYGRGEDEIADLPVMVVVGKPTDRETRERAAPWADGDGVQSLKRAIEGHAWQSCGDVQVVFAEFEVVTIAGVQYLSVTLSCNITGPGRDT